MEDIKLFEGGDSLDINKSSIYAVRPPLIHSDPVGEDWKHPMTLREIADSEEQWDEPAQVIVLKDALKAIISCIDNENQSHENIWRIADGTLNGISHALESKLPPPLQPDPGTMDEQQYRELGYDERRAWDAKMRGSKSQLTNTDEQLYTSLTHDEKMSYLAEWKEGQPDRSGSQPGEGKEEELTINDVSIELSFKELSFKDLIADDMDVISTQEAIVLCKKYVAALKSIPKEISEWADKLAARLEDSDNKADYHSFKTEMILKDYIIFKDSLK